MMLIIKNVFNVKKEILLNKINVNRLEIIVYY